MQVIPRCKKLWIVRNSLNLLSTHFASFHSTPVCYDKSKKNSNSDFKGAQQPSKNSVKFAIRQKRAATKKALRNLLSDYGIQGATSKGFSLRINDEPWKAHQTNNCNAQSTRKMQTKSCYFESTRGSQPRSGYTDSTRKRRSKSEPLRAEKIHNHRMRRNYRKNYFAEDDYPDRWYTWSFGSWNETSRSSNPRFDWREAFRGTNGGQAEWKKVNEADSEDAACNVGLPQDRRMLGLSSKGPLKMKDVKDAFHLSALKWHPDKHQGPTQAAAEEKFKLCVNAYKSLCSALSGA